MVDLGLHMVDAYHISLSNIPQHITSAGAAVATAAVAAPPHPRRTPQVMAAQLRYIAHAITQATWYAKACRARYVVLTCYEYFWFLKFDAAPEPGRNPSLAISRAFHKGCKEPTVLQVC